MQRPEADRRQESEIRQRGAVGASFAGERPCPEFELVGIHRRTKRRKQYDKGIHYKSAPPAAWSLRGGLTVSDMIRGVVQHCRWLLFRRCIAIRIRIHAKRDANEAA